MVVEPFDAHVALVAMGRSGRPVDVAGLAELYLKRVRFDGHLVDILFVSDRVVSVAPTHWDLFQLLTFVFPEDLGDEAGVPEPDYQEHNLNDEIDEGS